MTPAKMSFSNSNKNPVQFSKVLPTCQRVDFIRK